jgi:hypothetical protein
MHPLPYVTACTAFAGLTISCGSLAEELRLLQLPASQTMMVEALTASQPRVVRNTSKLLEVRPRSFPVLVLECTVPVCCA